jgi:ribonuclease E
MSDATTGRPVEVPADPPGTPPAAPQVMAPVASGDTGSPPLSPPMGRGSEDPDADGLNPSGPTGPGQQPARSGQNRRRRGSRGGRGRSRSATSATSATSASPPVPGEDGSPADPLGPAPMTPAAMTPAASSESDSPPVTASGPGLAPRPVPERPKIGDSRPARPPATDSETDSVLAPAGNGRGSTGGRRSDPTASRGPGRAAGGGRTRQRPSPSGEAVAASRTPTPSGAPTRGEGRRGGRERRGKALGRYMICVHVRPDTTQIALLEGRTLVEHYISRASDDATQIDGNIYRGRVQNVLPGMEAAFIDIGTPKNAVLYHGDVRYDTEDVESGGSPGQPRIEQLLRPGQTILCQVTKNPIGAKGARLTQEVSLPGRFVVLVPNSTAYGISKRLEDAERKRLRRIVDAIRPEGHGLIVRTAAAGASAEELGNDVNLLVAQWKTIAAEAGKGQGPALLYREPAIAVRVIREELNREYRAVVIDDLDLFEEVRDYVGAVNPELADRVEYFDPEVELLPVFERYHVHEQLHKALDRKVYLPSGGSLVIDRTEALTVIDVNTGKNVGTTNLEETVYRNNLEAAEEVARQLRLRDIGGIIVIDFIDMEIRENRDKVGSALRSALARDKTRTQVFDISELGLVEMTRKRVSEGLIESMSTTCEVCEGRGIIFDDPEL